MLQHEAEEIVVGSPGCFRRDTDATGLVWRPRHAGGELGGPVAGEHHVGVTVDESGDHASAIGVDATVGVDRAGVSEFHDQTVFDGQCCVVNDAEEAVADCRIVRHQNADAVHHRRRHVGASTGR